MEMEDIRVVNVYGEVVIFGRNKHPLYSIGSDIGNGVAGSFIPQYASVVKFENIKSKKAQKYLDNASWASYKTLVSSGHKILVDMSLSFEEALMLSIKDEHRVRLFTN